MLLKEEAAIDELSVTLEFFFNEQLRYIVHDLWAEVLQFKKLYHWIWIASVFPVDQLSQEDL